MKRCSWADHSELDKRYHDQEWGVPSFDDCYLFEMLTLEGAQAGLSWSTILRKREGYRVAFAQFDYEKVARFSADRIDKLIRSPSVVRHRGKIESVVNNAQRILSIRETYGAFSTYLWRFVEHEPRTNYWRTAAQVPTATLESETMSRALKKDGFRFVGPTTCYAFMQAVGMVNDHLTNCFRHKQLADKLKS